MFGKSLPILGILLIAMLAIGGVSAAVVNYLSNTVTKPATVASPIALTGKMEYWPTKQDYLFDVRGSQPAGAWWAPDGKSGYSAGLYVQDGTKGWAEVSIPVDIALKDIIELKFWEMIESYTTGYSVNVVLGIDLENDGFTADVAGWHVGTDSWTLAALDGDTFVEMDGVTGNPNPDVWSETDTLSVSQWWTPDESGAGFAKSSSYPSTFYGSFANFVNGFLVDSTQTSLIPDANARVKCIKLLIGGSGSWMEERAFVDLVTVNEAVYDLEPVIVTEDFDGVAFTPTLFSGGEFFMRFEAENLANRDMHIMLALVMQCPGTWTPNDPALEIWEIQPFGKIVAAGLSESDPESDPEYLVYVFDLQNIGPGSVNEIGIMVRLTPIAEPGPYTIKAFTVWGDIINELPDDAAKISYVLGV